MRVRAIVHLADGVLDPQGDAVRRALGDLGVDGVASVRQGKVFDIDVDAADRAEAEAQARRMCAALLANPVTETFHVEVLDEFALSVAGASGGADGAS